MGLGTLSEVSVPKYTLGGYQVLKKWLSYREEPLLGRPLHKEEARYFAQVVRRVAAILLMGRLWTGAMPPSWLPLPGCLCSRRRRLAAGLCASLQNGRAWSSRRSMSCFSGDA